jgi:hypothetical protein
MEKQQIISKGLKITPSVHILTFNHVIPLANAFYVISPLQVNHLFIVCLLCFFILNQQDELPSWVEKCVEARHHQLKFITSSPKVDRRKDGKWIFSYL